ncbi:hypothetical protein LIER_07999 [Lithospermum erythrorhizon]|uniref:Uncharacterized protein n=1 Tax=Lithospermum erythrorhizon TaxID=34254 RepID=A0AAV3PC30_LITER
MHISMPDDPFSSYPVLHSAINYSQPLPQLSQNQSPFFELSSFLSSKKPENTYKKRQHTPPKEESSDTKTTKLESSNKGNLQMMMESSQNPISTFLEKVAAPEKEKETSSPYLMIQDCSSDDESLSPVMMVGAFPQEDEIESEVENFAAEQM